MEQLMTIFTYVKGYVCTTVPNMLVSRYTFDFYTRGTQFRYMLGY
jgi:hypothetical protein